METYDMLLMGGQVLDPATGMHERADVAIRDGKVAGIGEIGGQAASVVDCTGCLVVPGLIDVHAHLWPLSNIGVQAESYAFPSGVTTLVDAGSAGWATYASHRPALEGMRVRVKSFVNVSAAGLAGLRGCPEDIDPAHFNERAIADLLQRYPEDILGLKIRSGLDTARDMGLEPLREACRMARRLGTRVMVHCTNPPASMAELIACLDAGDILTHPYHGHGETLLGTGGLEAARAARARGVLLDVGDARHHLSFAVARTALAHGLSPDTISTDMTMTSLYKPERAFSLPFCMSRFLALGMALADVVRAVTWDAARAMGLSHVAGTLIPGRAADVAVLSLAAQETRFLDGVGDCLEGEVMMRPMLTVKDGIAVYRDIEF